MANVADSYAADEESHRYFTGRKAFADVEKITKENVGDGCETGFEMAGRGEFLVLLRSSNCGHKKSHFLTTGESRSKRQKCKYIL